MAHRSASARGLHPMRGLTACGKVPERAPWVANTLAMRDGIAAPASDVGPWMLTMQHAFVTCGSRLQRCATLVLPYLGAATVRGPVEARR